MGVKEHYGRREGQTRGILGVGLEGKFLVKRIKPSQWYTWFAFLPKICFVRSKAKVGNKSFHSTPTRPIHHPPLGVGGKNFQIVQITSQELQIAVQCNFFVGLLHVKGFPVFDKQIIFVTFKIR